MQVKVEKGEVSGMVSVPSSKSILQRYIIAALLAEGVTELQNVSHCDDTLACLAAVEALGAEPLKDSKPFRGLQIKGCSGKINSSAVTIHCGESGLALRMLASVSSLSENKITLTGKGSLLNRPVDFFEKVFPLLNIKCNSQNGFLPLEIQGPPTFKNISVDGSLSSQFLSGLLMIFPFAKEDHVIEVKNLKSKQYIDLTLQVIAAFGIKIENDNYKKFFIKGNQTYKACNATIEGDWSAASFLLVAGATAGSVTVENISADSLQPDKAIIDVLKSAGARISSNKNSLTVQSPNFQFPISFFQPPSSNLKPETSNLKLQTSNLKPFSFDATDCPDLFPPLVALAVQCKGTSEITGVERLIHKESNRALALQQEFSKLNENLISIEGNKMIIKGGLKLKSAVCDSHNDHRIAMALAVTALNVEGGIQIKGYEAVNKSYPEFFTHIEKLKQHLPPSH